jgi:hypothetical protein
MPILIDAHDLVEDVILVGPLMPRLKADRGEDPSQLEIMEVVSPDGVWRFTVRATKVDPAPEQKPGSGTAREGDLFDRPR